MGEPADVVFPRFDPVGPGTPGLVVPDAGVVADLVAVQATAADAEGVSRTVLDGLAAAGLLGSPLEPSAAQRELGELISGSDASTWFCWVQHQTPLRTLEGAEPGPETPAARDLRDEFLPGLRAGRLVAGVAFAHVRRPGPANPVATRVPGGWRLDGTLDWVTSWDVADVVMVMAQGADADAGLLVCCFLPGGMSRDVPAGCEPGPALALLSMSGTHTRPVQLRGVRVPMGRVAAVMDRSAWLATDAVRTADANPSAFGVTRGATAELRMLADQRADSAMTDLADALAAECRALRARAYALADADAAVPARLEVRASSLDLVARATTSVIVARAGASMRRGHAAERRMREAMFLQVQAQTAATRTASLRLLLHRSTSGAPGR